MKPVGVLLWFHSYFIALLTWNFQVFHLNSSRNRKIKRNYFEINYLFIKPFISLPYLSSSLLQQLLPKDMRKLLFYFTILFNLKSTRNKTSIYSKLTTWQLHYALIYLNNCNLDYPQVLLLCRCISFLHKFVTPFAIQTWHNKSFNSAISHTICIA